MITRKKSNTLRPKWYTNHEMYTITNSSSESHLSEPTCNTQAAKSPVWRMAMATELSALAKNSTWDLIVPPSNAHIIGCK
jgi:hypothetical protein